MKGGSVKRSQASDCSVDHDAVLEESGQAAALHANQISQLRELFVHWPWWLLRARGLPSHTHTHIHIQEATDTLIAHSHQYIPASFHPSAGFLSVCILSLFSVCLGCCLVAVAMFTLSRLSPSVLCSLSFCLSSCTATAEDIKLTRLQLGLQSKMVFLEEVIHYMSNVEMTVVRQNMP